MTDILLLDTFHFSDVRPDIGSSTVQDELDALVEGLMRFCPDAIIVEAATHAQTDIDRAYAAFRSEDLRDPAKMQNETLGGYSFVRQNVSHSIFQRGRTGGLSLGQTARVREDPHRR